MPDLKISDLREERELRIWLINHYAVSPAEPGSLRHHDMARALKAYNIDMTIIASNYNHFALKKYHEEGVQVIEDIRYLWIDVPEYSGSGIIGQIRRGINMLTFSRKLKVLTMNLLEEGELPRPDLIIGSNAHIFAADTALTIANKLGVPFILELRDLWPQGLIEAGVLNRNSPIALYMRMLERKLVRSASGIITLTRSTLDYLRNCYGADIPSKCFTMTNGLVYDNLKKLNLNLDSLPSELRVLIEDLEDKFKVCYAGSLSRVHASELLLDVAKRLSRDIHIIVIGDGPLKANMLSVARTEGITNLHMVPPLPRRELWTALNYMDALLITARIWGSSNKLADYLVVSKPILFAINSPEKGLKELGDIASLQADEIAGKLLLIRERYSEYLKKVRKYAPKYREILDLKEKFRQLAKFLSSVLAEAEASGRRKT